MTGKLLFLHQQPHPVHGGFARAIDASFFFYDPHDLRLLPALSFFIGPRLNAKKIPDFDVCLCEGGLPVAFAVAAKKQKKLHDSIIIELAADETFSRLTADIPEPMHALAKKRWQRLYEHIDGVIAVSQFIKNDAAKVLACPIKIAYPFILDRMYDSLKNIQPDLDAHTIVSIGYAHKKNSMDILVKAFGRVKKRFDDAELYVIGRGHPKEWGEKAGVNVTGFVELKKFKDCLKKASLAVLVGRGQAFPVSTLESLCAGIPTMVTNQTGTKEVIAELGQTFVRNVTADDAITADNIANGITDYFDRSSDEKKRLSKKSKELASRFTEGQRKRQFAETFHQLVEEIKQKKSMVGGHG